MILPGDDPRRSDAPEDPSPPSEALEAELAALEALLPKAEDRTAEVRPPEGRADLPPEHPDGIR